MMIISQKMSDIIRILLTSENKSINDVAKKADITPAMASRILKRLEDSGYARINRKVQAVNKDRLLKVWGYSYSLRELPNVQFLGAERPQYIMKKIINIAREAKLIYAFTMFSATDHVSPYVVPSDTHLYILEEDVKKWEKIFLDENILPTKTGNVICILKKNDFFENNTIHIENSNAIIVSFPQLYADLLSFGGRGEEAAEYILKIIRKIY